MRVFIALDIPQEIRTRITEYMEHAKSLAPNARWARVEGLHVTLKFVGEVSEARVQQIKTALASVKSNPFEVKFEGVGFFPNEQKPRSFWIGVGGGQQLRNLAMNLNIRLEFLGFKSEVKPYKPHITLARIQYRTDESKRLASFLNSELATQFGTMIAKQFILFRSQMGKGGSTYTELASFQLT
jgi:2'-5' RNA ligase